MRFGDFTALGSPLHKKRRYLMLQGDWRQPSYDVTFSVLIMYTHFNLSNFNVTVHRLIVVKILMHIYHLPTYSTLPMSL